MSRKRSLEPENVGASTTKQKEVSMFKKRKEGDSSEKTEDLTLTLKNILTATESVVGWYQMGIYLNFKKSRLDIIRANHPNDVEGAKTELISEWLNNDPGKSWDKLAAVLRQMRCCILSDEISKFGQAQSNMSYMDEQATDVTAVSITDNPTFDVSLMRQNSEMTDNSTSRSGTDGWNQQSGNDEQPDSIATDLTYRLKEKDSEIDELKKKVRELDEQVQYYALVVAEEGEPQSNSWPPDSSRNGTSEELPEMQRKLEVKEEALIIAKQENDRLSRQLSDVSRRAPSARSTNALDAKMHIHLNETVGKCKDLEKNLEKASLEVEQYKQSPRSYEEMDHPPVEVKISGADERVQVNPCTSPPYKWICFLQIESSYIGTGFKIRVPGINRMLIMTSGHCVYDRNTNNYFNSVTVFFQDGTSATAQQQDLYAPKELKKKNPDVASDYGVICLPGDSEDGFGWSAAISDGDINGRLATICGYPGDKPRQTMWTTGGEIEKVTPNEIFYKRDIIGGQPGSPVYTWYKGYWTVIGLLSYESHVNNHGPRFNSTMIYNVLNGSKTIKTYSVESKRFPQASLRLNGKDFDSPSRRGGGIVNCQYKPPGDYEKFYIYPVEVSPSLAQQPHPTIYVIRSAYWENRALRLDGTGINKFNSKGSGIVNCQYGSKIGPYEHFIFGRSNIEVISIQNNGEYYIRSVYFTKCYLRINGKGATCFQDRGSGTVNCQYYASPSDVHEDGFELFTLKEL